MTQKAVPVEPKLAPGAERLEDTRRNAEFWFDAGQSEPNRDKAIRHVAQALFAWKNAAYGLARELAAAPVDGGRADVLEEKWMPIETAPKDNKRPLMLARFDDDGNLSGMDWDASWESERESWEMPELYWLWRSALGTVEEPTHWMYQPEGFSAIRAAKGE